VLEYRGLLLLNFQFCIVERISLEVLCILHTKYLNILICQIIMIHL